MQMVRYAFPISGIGIEGWYFQEWYFQESGYKNKI